MFNERYTVVKLLGEGGLSRIFLARDALYDNALIALKTIHVDRGKKELLSNLQNEFLTLRQFDHPNLVKVFDFGRIVSSDLPEHRDDVFFTLEYVEGMSLFEATESPEWESIYELIYQLAHALDYIHRHGLIHFDLKPQNILVTDGYLDEEPARIVKIIDFGLAAATIDTGSLQPRGSIHYLAPELITGDRFDHRVDLYSLGATLFEILARRPLFTGNSPLEIIKGHLAAPPPPLKDIRGDIPPQLCELVDSLLVKDPEHRLSDARRVAERIAGLFRREQRFHRLIADTPPRKTIGRRAEISQLLQLLRNGIRPVDAHDAKKPIRIVCVSGEAGIGKTTLLTEIGQLAQTEGIVFLETRCHSERSIPYQFFRRLVRELVFVLRTHAGQGEEVLRQFSPLLSTFLPDLFAGESGSPTVKLTSPDSIYYFYETATKFLARASVLEPYALWIDDIHLADQSSLDLLCYVIQGIARSPVVIFLTAQSEGEMEEILNTSRADSTAIHLSGLDEADIGALAELMLRTPLPTPTVHQLAAVVGASPQVLKEILSQFSVLPPDQALNALQQALDEPERLHIPRTIDELYTQRLIALKPEERSLLSMMSCLRGPATFSLLCRVSPYSPGRLMHFLRELSRNGSLISSDGGTKYQFAQAQFQQHVYRAVLERKEEIHLLIAQALEQSGDQLVEENLEEIAYHYHRGGAHREGYAYYVRAAEKARSIFSFKENLFFLEEAARIGTRGREEDESLLEKLAEGYMLVGDHGKASQFYHRLVDNYSPTPSKRLDYLKSLAKVQTRQGMLQEALHSLNEALTLSHSTEESMELEGELIALDISQGHFEAARQRCLNAIERFNDPSNRAGLGIFYNALGIVYFYQNKFDEAAQYFTRARALLEPGAPKDKLISNYLNLGNVFSAQDNFTEAERHWQRALVLSKEIGNVQQEAQIYNNLGISSYKSARYDDALRYYQQALEIFTRIGNLPGKAFCLTNTGEVHFTQSESQKALACWRESLRLYQSLQDNQGLADTHNQLAQIDILLEDLEPARHHLDIAAEITEHGQIESQRGLCYLLSGSVAILEGNLKRAEELVASAKAFFKSIKDEKGYLLSLLKLGEVARLGSQPRVAREFFEEALQVSSQCNLPLLRAEALLQLALEARAEGSGRQEKPVAYLKEAFGLIQHEVVCETTWKVCYHLGKEYLGRGLDARGKEFLRHAQKVLEFLSSSFTEEELRRKFLASQRRGEILNEINLLCMNSVHGRQN